MKKHKILVIETNEVYEWSVYAMLHEINRDRHEWWEDYNESDYLEGWDAFVDGEFYKRLD